MYGGVGEKEEDPKNTSLEGRIAKYYIITEALNPASFTESCLENYGEKYKIKDKDTSVVLELSRKEGVSTSANSYIFYTNVEHTTAEPITYNYEIVSKLMIPYQKVIQVNKNDVKSIEIVNGTPNNKYNEKEIKLMETITSRIITDKLSRHFLLMYFYSMCNISVPVDELNPYNHNRSFVIYTEPANGDVGTLLNDEVFKLDNETILNAFIQSIIALGTFHNIFGYIHNDCHMGNFLYQENSQHTEDTPQYYQYTFNSDNYLLKSCKYNMMIYDFGLAIKIADIHLSVNIITSIILDNIKKGIINKIDYKSAYDLKVYEYDITYKSTDKNFKIEYRDNIEYIEETDLRTQIGENIKNNTNSITKNKYIGYIRKYIQNQLKEDYMTLVVNFVDEVSFLVKEIRDTREIGQQDVSNLDRLEEFFEKIDISTNIENIKEDGDKNNCEEYIFNKVMDEVIGLCNNLQYYTIFFNKISKPTIASSSIINAQPYKISR